MIKLGKITQDDIDGCVPHFEKLDKDGDGVLTVKDLSKRERQDYDSGHGVRETRASRGPLLFESSITQSADGSQRADAPVASDEQRP